jgi:hypothetical protein
LKCGVTNFLVSLPSILFDNYLAKRHDSKSGKTWILRHVDTKIASVSSKTSLHYINKDLTISYSSPNRKTTRKAPYYCFVLHGIWV